MVFNHALSVEEHINSKIDSSVFPEETHHILQGNIGSLVAGNSRLHFTYSETPSILGIAGDTKRQEKIITSKNCKAISQSGELVNIPCHFYDDKVPILTGESGFAVDWGILKNPKNNIGYSLNFKGERALGFPYRATPGDNIQPIPHSPPIELVERDGPMIPTWKSIPGAFPGLRAPVGDWTKQ